MTYREKYLKYKNKYLQLKNQIGGSTNDELNDFFKFYKISDIGIRDFLEKFCEKIIQDVGSLTWSNIFYCNELYIRIRSNPDTNDKKLIELFEKINLSTLIKQIPHDKLNVNYYGCNWSNINVSPSSSNENFDLFNQIIDRYNKGCRIFMFDIGGGKYASARPDRFSSDLIEYQHLENSLKSLICVINTGGDDTRGEYGKDKYGRLGVEYIWSCVYYDKYFEYAFNTWHKPPNTFFTFSNLTQISNLMSEEFKSFKILINDSLLTTNKINTLLKKIKKDLGDINKMINITDLLNEYLKQDIKRLPAYPNFNRYEQLIIYELNLLDIIESKPLNPQILELVSQYKDKIIENKDSSFVCGYLFDLIK